MEHAINGVIGHPISHAPEGQSIICALSSRGPQAGLRTATWVPGTAGHSWQGVAAGGTSIGLKGTKLAAQVLADTAQDLFKDPEILDLAKKEYQEKVGDDFEYYPLLGGREPPLNYRN